MTHQMTKKTSPSAPDGVSVPSLRPLSTRRTTTPAMGTCTVWPPSSPSPCCSRATGSTIGQYEKGPGRVVPVIDPALITARSEPAVKVLSLVLHTVNTREMLAVVISPSDQLLCVSVMKARLNMPVLLVKCSWNTPAGLDVETHREGVPELRVHRWRARCPGARATGSKHVEILASGKAAW